MAFPITTTSALILWIHVLAAAVWVGGLVSLAFLSVGLKDTVSPAERIRIMGGVGKNMRWIFWSMLLLAILTGFANIIMRQLPLTVLLDPAFLTKTRFGHLIFVKSVMILGILVLTGYHSFVVGPRLVEKAKTLATQVTGQQEALRKLRLRAVMANALNVVLGVAVLLVGAFLRFS